MVDIEVFYSTFACSSMMKVICNENVWKYYADHQESEHPITDTSFNKSLYTALHALRNGGFEILYFMSNVYYTHK